MSNKINIGLEYDIIVDVPYLKIINNELSSVIIPNTIKWVGTYLAEYLEFTTEEIYLPNIITFMVNVMNNGRGWVDDYLSLYGFTETTSHMIPTEIINHIDNYLEIFIRDRKIEGVL